MHIRFTATLFTTALLFASPLFSADGETVFKACEACHTRTAGDVKKFGPHLEKVVGRACGSVQGYEYSKGYQKACAKGKISWTEAEIAAYLDNPTKYLKSKGGGRSKMSFMLKDEAKRKAVLKLLKNF